MDFSGDGNRSGRSLRRVDGGASAPQLRAIAQTLAHWQADADLASLRGDAIDSLPESERPDWKQLWSDVDTLLARAREASSTETITD